MASKNPYYKPRMGNVVVGILLFATIFNEGTMVAESATVVGEVPAEVQGLAEDVGLMVCFVFLGVYGSSKSASKQAFITGITSLAEIIPYLNDLPVGAIEVLVVTYISRKEDRENADAQLAEALEMEKQQAAEQEELIRRSQEVAARSRAGLL
jgi:hypothetical protein